MRVTQAEQRLIDYLDRTLQEQGRCWCGTQRPYRETSPALMTSSCGGTGELDCLCGGDQCVCHNHGAVECGDCYACGEDR